MIKRLRLLKVCEKIINQRLGVSIIACFTAWQSTFISCRHARLRIYPKLYNSALIHLYRNISRQKIRRVLYSRSNVYYLIRAYCKCLKQFKKIARRRRASTKSKTLVKQLLARNALAASFGAWLILVAKNIDCERKGNKLICKTFKSIMWNVFFAWHHMYVRSSLIRHSEREKLAAYSIELKSRMRVALGKREKKTRQQV
jgi:hypothetical protein